MRKAYICEDFGVGWDWFEVGLSVSSEPEADERRKPGEEERSFFLEVLSMAVMVYTDRIIEACCLALESLRRVLEGDATFPFGLCGFRRRPCLFVLSSLALHSRHNIDDEPPSSWSLRNQDITLRWIVRMTCEYHPEHRTAIPSPARLANRRVSARNPVTSHTAMRKDCTERGTATAMQPYELICTASRINDRTRP